MKIEREVIANSATQQSAPNLLWGRLTSDLNGIKNKIGGYFSDLHPKSEVIQLDPEQILARRNSPAPTPTQISQEITQFSHLIARIVPMRTIGALCRIDKPEDFYLELSVSAGSSDEALKKAFFKHLDESRLFFLVRWVAKIAYRFLIPFTNKIVEEATFSVFKNIETYLDRKKKKEFNARFNDIIERSNDLLEHWKIALKNCTSADEERSLRFVLRDELSKPKYTADRTTEQFYLDVTNKAIEKFYVKISAGKYIYDKLMIFKILYPIALAVRLLFVVPDYFFNWFLVSFLKKTLINNHVVENITERVQEGISTNKGISVPVLKVLNENLEEVLAELEGKVTLRETQENPLSVKNQKLLELNVSLLQDAVNRFSNVTVKDLKKMLSSENRNPAFSAEVQSASEDIIKSLYQKLTDPVSIKHQGYYVLKSVNQSLSKRTESAEERDAEFIDQEARLFILIQEILQTAIGKKVQEKTGFSEGYISNYYANYYSKQIRPMVERILDMVLSREFLNYQIRAAMASEFLDHPKFTSG